MTKRPQYKLATTGCEDPSTYLSLPIPVHQIFRSVSPRSRVDVAVPLHIHGESETSQVSRLYFRTNPGEPIGDVETS